MKAVVLAIAVEALGGSLVGYAQGQTQEQLGAPEGRPAAVSETTGEYLGQQWRIDRQGVVYWNGRPYARLTFTFAWEERQVRFLAEQGITQFGLPIPEDLSERDERGIEEAVDAAERVANLIEELGGTYFAGLSNMLLSVQPEPDDELRYLERSVVEVPPSDGPRRSLRVCALRYRAAGRRLPGPWVLNVPRQMQRLCYTGKSRAFLFDSQRNRYQPIPAESVRVRLLSASQTPPELLGRRGDRGDRYDEDVQTDAEPERDQESPHEASAFSPAFRIDIDGFPIPAGRPLKLVVLHKLISPKAVTEELGTLPAVWKPGVARKFLDLVRRYRRAFRKPGLRAMDFGEEQHLLDISLINPFNLYPDFRQDEIATRTYRTWLKLKFGDVESLNRYLGTRYRSFDEVQWQVPLTPITLPDSVYLRVWRAEWDTIYDSGLVRQTFGVYGSVQQMARLDALQWEFRDWLYAHHLADLARQAQQIIGHVPTFVASSDFDDHPLRRFRFHRMLMEEGMEGMIRNWYTVPVRDERGFGALPPGRHQDELPRLLEQAMRASGKTKTLLANEIGWAEDRPGWPVFRSEQDLRSVIGVMGTCGFRGFHLFSDPTSPEARENVRWVAELQDEILALMLTKSPPPPRKPRRITGGQAVAAARADRRVQDLLKGMPDPRTEVEFSEQWRVWLVHFHVGDRPVAFASVSTEGRVLEAGRPERDGDTADRGPSDSDRQREIEELERQLQAARKAGDQAEAGEIQAIIRRLKSHPPADEARKDANESAEGAERPAIRARGSSGQYMGHPWHIDQKHLIYWDGKPYVPFGGFGIRPGNPFGLDTYNLWIDFDPFIEKPDYTRQQHRRDIARQLEAIERSGGTCIVQFSMALPHLPDGPRPGMRWRQPEGGVDASRLADPKVREAIFMVWADYAPAVRNQCVRAVVLWNEINTWRWPDRMSADEYAGVLGQYVCEAKRLVGDVPVCFKIAGTWNAEAAVAAAAAADGLGFDVWFTGPNETRARREIERALGMLEARQKRTTWFFIAEGGRGIAEGGTDEAADGRSYWDNWPPFRSKAEALGILRAYAQAGAKGFIYNGPTSDPGSPYCDSYRWLGDIKQQIIRLMVDTKRLAIEK